MAARENFRLKAEATSHNPESRIPNPESRIPNSEFERRSFRLQAEVPDGTAGGRCERCSFRLQAEVSIGPSVAVRENFRLKAEATSHNPESRIPNSEFERCSFRLQAEVSR